MSDCSTEAFKAKEPHARMTKTKSQLRAEAVERLKNGDVGGRVEKLLLGDSCPNYWSSDTYTYGKRVNELLIDLLTDEEPRKFGVTVEQMAKASTDFFDNLPSVNGKNGDFLPTTAEDEDANCKKADSLQDSREKLEAEILDAGCADEIDYDRIVGWLDRQESITERHWMEICGANANANVELKRQIDVLEANNAQLHALIAELQVERDAYRDKLGRAVDAAYEVVRMVDES